LGGGFLLGSGGKASPPASPSGPPPTEGGGQFSPVSTVPKAGLEVTSSNILKAYHVALSHETDFHFLDEFGTALLILGYEKEGNELIARSSELMAKHA
jgi:hypothetical protein